MSRDLDILVLSFQSRDQLIERALIGAVCEGEVRAMRKEVGGTGSTYPTLR